MKKIFSDESGSWNGSHQQVDDNELYIRSWVMFEENKYQELEKEIIFTKYKDGLKELKFDNFKRNFENKQYYKDIFNTDFQVFITISKNVRTIDKFQNNKYKALNTLSNLDPNTLTGDPNMTSLTKDKFIQSAKMVLFLNYYEKQHIKNSIDALIGKNVICKDPDCVFYVDNPQFLNKDWKNVAQDAGVKKIKIVEHSENRPGIELADIIAGCTNEYIKDLVKNKNKNNSIAKNIYNTFIRGKLKTASNNNNKFYNPNLIFIEDFDQNFINLVNKNLGI